MWYDPLSDFQETKQGHISEEKATMIHGVLRCKDQDGILGHGFVHRDKNAAVNIMNIYDALADEERRERPIQFRPVRGSRYS